MPAAKDVVVAPAAKGAPATAPKRSERKEEGGSRGAGLLVILTTYFGYAVLLVMGHLRDLLGRFFGSRYKSVEGIKVSDRAEAWPRDRVWSAVGRRRIVHAVAGRGC